MNKKALVAMSGGVDSSVAAYLMKQSGYDCMGATMKLFDESDYASNNKKNIPSTGCINASTQQSQNNTAYKTDCAAETEEIAKALHMSFSVVDFSEKFKEYVINQFIYSYENGMTPNPCIVCNRHLKFDELFKYAMSLGYDLIATGHYVRIRRNEDTGRYELLKAVDLSKDQSYVLYSLTQQQLSHAVFPLGSLSKSEVRSIAMKQGFLNADKKESQDICFIPDGRYADFIEKYTGKSYPEGNFIDTSGNILGTHKGIIRYTIGQRKGLGLSFSQPMYVSMVDPVSNTVTLAENEALFSRALTAHNINLISVGEISSPMRVTAKARYSHKEQWATVTQPDKDTLYVEFDEPQRAITKGQSVVLYNDEVVVGGGIICGTSVMH